MAGVLHTVHVSEFTSVLYRNDQPERIRTTLDDLNRATAEAEQHYGQPLTVGGYSKSADGEWSAVCEPCAEQRS